MSIFVRYLIAGCISVLATSAFSASKTNAAIIMDLQEVDGVALLTVVGSLDLTGAEIVREGPYANGIFVFADQAVLATGTTGFMNFYDLTESDGFFGTGFPQTFGGSTGGGTPDQEFALWIEEDGIEQVGVPRDYVSGSPIDGFYGLQNLTIDDLQLVPGVYNFALPNDTIILTIGTPSTTTPPTMDPPTAVSLPAAMPLLAAGLGIMGLFGWRRKQGK